MLVGNKFPPLLRTHNRFSRGSSHKNNNSLSPNEILITLKHHLNHNLSDVLNSSTSSLLGMNK